jgi:hypothetical protein
LPPDTQGDMAGGTESVRQDTPLWGLFLLMAVVQ